MNTKRSSAPVVFVVDDDDFVREAIESVLTLYGYPVRGFADGVSFLDSIDETSEGCLLLDLRMPGMDGLSTAEEMHHRGYWMPMAFLSGAPDTASTVQAIKLGATDFMVKPVSADRLLTVVEELSAQIGQIHAVADRAKQARLLLNSLTHREREVMDGMLHGLQNKQIARALGISHRTVEIHRARVMQKAHARNLLELARVLEPAIGMGNVSDIRAAQIAPLEAPLSRRA